jgi:hypothetical protein
MQRQNKATLINVKSNVVEDDVEVRRMPPHRLLHGEEILTQPNILIERQRVSEAKCANHKSFHFA